MTKRLFATNTTCKSAVRNSLGTLIGPDTLPSPDLPLLRPCWATAVPGSLQTRGDRPHRPALGLQFKVVTPGTGWTDEPSEEGTL